MLSTHVAARKKINGKGGGAWRAYLCHSHLFSRNRDMLVSIRSARPENAEAMMVTSNRLDLLDNCSRQRWKVKGSAREHWGGARE